MSNKSRFTITMLEALAAVRAEGKPIHQKMVILVINEAARDHYTQLVQQHGLEDVVRVEAVVSALRGMAENNLPIVVDDISTQEMIDRLTPIAQRAALTGIVDAPVRRESRGERKGDGWILA